MAKFNAYKLINIRRSFLNQFYSFSKTIPSYAFQKSKTSLKTTPNLKTYLTISRSCYFETKLKDTQNWSFLES